MHFLSCGASSVMLCTGVPPILKSWLHHDERWAELMPRLIHVPSNPQSKTQAVEIQECIVEMGGQL
jgi:hypothetical protein